MKKYLFIITLLAAALSSLTLPAGISVRIGGPRYRDGHRHGYYRSYPHRYYRRGYHHRPYYRAPRYRYHRYNTYYQPIRYCRGDACYNYGYVTDAIIKEIDMQEGHALLILDNGMVFKINKPSYDVTGQRALLFARQDSRGNIISFRTDDFGVKVDEGRPDYRLVIQGREYRAERQN